MRRLLLLLAAILPLAACGLKGDLYLEPVPATAQDDADGPEPAAEDEREPGENQPVMVPVPR
jgi:predicted small lipoprotein YifL